MELMLIDAYITKAKAFSELNGIAAKTGGAIFMSSTPAQQFGNITKIINWLKYSALMQSKQAAMMMTFSNRLLGNCYIHT